jgi:hypothetical protein
MSLLVTPTPEWPETVVQYGRHYNWESDLDHYQVALIAIARGEDVPLKPPRPPNDRLVSLREAAARFGVTRRTIGRRIHEQHRPASPRVPQVVK